MSGDDIAQFLYLGLFAGLLASGTLALFRSNISQSLKMVGAWIVIFVLIMGIYAVSRAS